MSHLSFSIYLFFFYQIAKMIKKLIQVSGWKSTNQLSIPTSISFYRCRAKKVAAGENWGEELRQAESFPLEAQLLRLLLLTTTNYYLSPLRPQHHYGPTS